MLTGQYTAYRLIRRVIILEKIQLMLSSIENEISFRSSPSYILIKSLGENPQLSELGFIGECLRRTGGGEDFHSAWKSSVSMKENVRYLKKEDTALLISFGELFGTTDTEGQISNCRLHSELVRDKLREARDIRDRYASLFMGMGIVCGVGIVIVLV